MYSTYKQSHQFSTYFIELVHEPRLDTQHRQPAIILLIYIVALF